MWKCEQIRAACSPPEDDGCQYALCTRILYTDTKCLMGAVKKIYLRSPKKCSYAWGKI